MTVFNRFAAAAIGSRTISPFVAIHSPSAAAPRGSGGPSRADRAAKSASTQPGGKAVVTGSAGEVRRTRPGNSQQAATAPGGSRFAHFAGMAAASEPKLKTAPPSAELFPVSAAMREAEARREIARSGGRIPGVNTPEEAADFVLAAAAKARGQTVQAGTAAKPAPARPNLSTPEAAADFVLASAAKARGQQHDMNTPEGVAASAVALARRTGVIR